MRGRFLTNPSYKNEKVLLESFIPAENYKEMAKHVNPVSVILDFWLSAATKTLYKHN